MEIQRGRKKWKRLQWAWEWKWIRVWKVGACNIVELKEIEKLKNSFVTFDTTSKQQLK